MSDKQKKFTPRIIKTGGINIYAGPCHQCPKSIEPWIKQFCSLPENNWLTELDKEWAIDNFNCFGLDEFIPDFQLALDLIADEHSHEWKYLTDKNIADIGIQAKMLYGLLHSRWICQTRGLAQMKVKYNSGIFGTCPRILCNSTKLIPMGVCTQPKQHFVKLFCPCCYDIYSAPPNIKFDGSFFGPAFPNIFLLDNPNFDMAKNFVPLSHPLPDQSEQMKQRYEPHRTNVQQCEYPEKE